MSVNMQLPPPTVTGVAIPATLATKGDLAVYKELQNIRGQARDELTTTYNKPKNRMKKVLKYTAGALMAVAAFIGIGKLTKLIK